MDDMKKKVTASAISQVMAELGKRGGSVSGVKKGVATLSKKERSERGKAAAKARWAKSVA